MLQWTVRAVVKLLYIYYNYPTVRYDTRCYFNVRSKADVSQLNLPHARQIWSQGFEQSEWWWVRSCWFWQVVCWDQWAEIQQENAKCKCKKICSHPGRKFDLEHCEGDPCWSQSESEGRIERAEGYRHTGTHTDKQRDAQTTPHACNNRQHRLYVNIHNTLHSVSYNKDPQQF